ncbi:S8 family peptidase [Telluribacter sp. SYSU D00476]|uniref:S8 family peptidase n=1 Tax=Telluribacter sp. SYSU D00476 TaxID=2811430 RepID=UPI001FF58EE1|nr:S8 family peptidase [Telluribacter sp. SYSU D00476]
MNFRKFSTTSAYVAVAVAFVVTGCMTEPDLVRTPQDGPASSARAAVDEYVPNELLVKFKAGIAESKRAEALARVNGAVAERILTKMMERVGDREGIFLIRTPLDVAEARGRLKGLGEIEYAEPNYIYTYDATSNDTYFTNGSLWGMYGDASTPANQYGSQAAEAWAAGKTGSASVVVGIIDEGIQVDHPDLKANIWTNPFDPVDGRDNDGNGYVDDVNGWDFDGNNNTVYDGGKSGGTDKHGTHVAGTIGAKSNGTGVVGVNWNVKMISCKFLGRRGGTTANAIKAVDYLTDLKIRHNINLVASNNSWGGGGFSQALLEAITRGANANILFIAAAGNGGSDGVGDNNDSQANYPSNYNTNGVRDPKSGITCNYDAVIAVASITSTGARSSFSNYGAATVDLGAPGSGIYSTLPPNAYGSYSGTSMATPHVTGGAALYAAGNPGSTAADIKSAILSSAVPTASLDGKCVTGGRLNVSGF